MQSSTVLAVIGELPADMHLVAAVRSRTDVDRLPARSSMKAVLVDLDIRSAAGDVETVVSAIRLREDIPPKALVDLHESIRSSAPDDGARIITIGGAGSLHMPGGRRFWEDPAFPARPGGTVTLGIRAFDTGADNVRTTDIQV